MKLQLTVDLSPIAPPLRLVLDFLRPIGARIVRAACQCLHPFDNPRVVVMAARALAFMEARP